MSVAGLSSQGILAAHVLFMVAIGSQLALGKVCQEPAVFGEGTISTGEFESHPAFTPDGKTMYFVRSTPQFTDWTIYESQKTEDGWSEPKIASFSGEHRDADPFITTDGKQLYFISDRPTDDSPKGDMDIWVMDRSDKGSWGEPKNLGAPINTSASEWFPTIAANGTLYFGSSRDGGHGNTDLYRARMRDGAYDPPENLGKNINGPADEFEGCIAPDESLIVFMAAGRSDSLGHGDLYISFFRDGDWTPAKNLGPVINGKGLEISPYLTLDGQHFLFSSARGGERIAPRERPKRAQNGLGDIYQMSVESLLKLAH